jgi:hypothetical protein
MKRDRGSRDGDDEARVDLKGRVMGGLTAAIVAAIIPLAYFGYNHSAVQGRDAPEMASAPVNVAGQSAVLTAHGSERAQYVLHWETYPPANFSGALLELAGGENVELDGWHFPTAEAPIADQLRLRVDRHGEPPTLASVELQTSAAYEQPDKIWPSIGLHVFMFGIILVFVVGSAIWLRMLWLPLARSLVRRS